MAFTEVRLVYSAHNLPLKFKIMSKTFALFVFIATGIFFFFFFLLPVSETVKVAFFEGNQFTLKNIKVVFDNPIYVEGLLNSLYMAIWSTLGSIIIALPLAILASRYSFPGKGLLSSLLLVPMILPPFVGVIGIKQLLGQAGVLNTALVKMGLMDGAHPFDWLSQGQMVGVVIMNALHLYPILYLNLTAALSNVDPAMEEAAENLGSSPGRRFWKVTFPLIRPGLFAGGIIVFIWAFTELGVPLMFDVQNITSVQIYNGIKDIGGNHIPYALVSIVLIVTVVMYLASKFFFGGGNFSGSGRAGMARMVPKLPFLSGLMTSAFFVFVILIALLPHLGVIFMSMAGDWYQSILPKTFTAEHYQAALSHDLTLSSIRNSLRYASFATLFDIVLGVAIAYVVVRTKIFGRGVLDAMAMLPLAVPGLVMAFGYLAMSKEGQVLYPLMLGENHDNPVLLLVIAYAVRRLPYVVRSAAAGYQQTSVTLEEAAQNLGSSPLRSLWRVTLPLISANLIAGGLLAFSFAMLEVSDSLVLAQQAQHYPITKAIYQLASALGNGDGLAAALGVWAMVFLAITIIGTSVILGRKMGALFRV